MNLFNIQRAFRQRHERGWPKLYWCIDLHDVIIPGSYSKQQSLEIYPGALEVLQWIKSRPDMCFILFTSSHIAAILPVLQMFAINGIKPDYINENPECPNNELCDFTDKFYYNILLDDKAGFEGVKDWYAIKDLLCELGVWAITI